MSKCYGCYFYESGYMINRCNYFKDEYFVEPNECLAFSTNGYLSKEVELQIFDETDGVFGKPMDTQ